LNPINRQDVFSDVKTGAVIVAHPDDETLWAGGTILMHPEINWTIMTLCRKSDPDRAPKFFRIMNILNAKGFMADLDDGPQQRPLEQAELQQAILNTLPQKSYDIVLTHGPKGEYTRHLRHEEVSRAVVNLWEQEQLKAKRLLQFAYEDGGKKYPPRPSKDADIVIDLPKNIRQKKKDIIINSYGFSPDSFEASVVSNAEAYQLITSKETEK
jgi:LmbE family N-acetylglucosaminyl deacetylase